MTDTINTSRIAASQTSYDPSASLYGEGEEEAKDAGESPDGVATTFNRQQPVSAALADRAFELLDRIDIQTRATGHAINGVSEIKAIVQALAQGVRDEPTHEMIVAAQGYMYVVFRTWYENGKIHSELEHTPKQVYDDTKKLLQAALVAGKGE